MTSYATVDEADAYFADQLYSQSWVNASSATKTKALARATQIIDRLAFSGEKHAASDARYAKYGTRDLATCTTQDILDAAGTQELQFPRGIDSEIPNDIKIASYEIAYALLDGVDPDKEFVGQKIVSQGYSSVRTTYDRSSPMDHINAGVPSPVAWRYLRPYIREGKGILLSRV